MIAELLIIIGLALMVGVIIKKLPIISSGNKEAAIQEERIMEKINYSEKIKEWLNSLKQLIAKNKTKKERKPSVTTATPSVSSIRGNTVYPSDAGNPSSGYQGKTEENEHNKKLNPFWTEKHRVENRPLMINGADKNFINAERLFAAKKFKEAEELYIKAASEDPENHKIFNRLGAIYMEQKNYSDAVEAFSAAVKIDSGIASRHYNLAIAYIAKGEALAAKRSLRIALQLDPTNLKYRKTLEDLH